MEHIFFEVQLCSEILIFKEKHVFGILINLCLGTSLQKVLGNSAANVCWVTHLEETPSRDEARGRLEMTSSQDAASAARLETDGEAVSRRARLKTVGEPILRCR